MKAITLYMLGWRLRRINNSCVKLPDLYYWEDPDKSNWLEKDLAFEIAMSRALNVPKIDKWCVLKWGAVVLASAGWVVYVVWLFVD